LSRFRHYIFLEKTEPRLKKLLKEFKFGPMRDLLKEYQEKANIKKND